MDRRAICIIIWFILVVAGSLLSKICPNNWLYNWGFFMGCLTFPFCYIALFDREESNKK